MNKSIYLLFLFAFLKNSSFVNSPFPSFEIESKIYLINFEGAIIKNTSKLYPFKILSRKSDKNGTFSV